MATINKASVRDEVERLNKDFEQLSSEGKIPSECILLFKSMFMLINLILAIFLEKTTKKDSKNSSLPPSQTDPDDSALNKGKTNGKGKSEGNVQSSNTRIRESITLSKVSVCDVCGEDLRNISPHKCERRTKIDIVFEKVVKHVDAEIKICSACESTVKAKFPSDMHGPLQYGNGVKSFIINLLVSQMVALKRVQGLVGSMIGSIISEASMLKFILRLHLALADWEASALNELLKSKALNVDETSLQVDKKKHWIHVYASGETTLKFLHRKRGKEAINDIDIIPRYGGVIIHDCLSSYLSYDHCGHGLCGSHLLREFTFVIDSNGYSWAKNLKRLLQQTCKRVSKSKRKNLTKKAYSNLQKNYRNILTRGDKELPPIPIKQKGKRGKIAKSDAHNLWERLKKHEKAVLLFAKDASVSFTNNRAEQDLRMSKVKQKVSGCFRTVIYAEAYCRISSYLQTMSNKGHNPLIAIQMALSGEKIN